MPTRFILDFPSLRILKEVTSYNDCVIGNSIPDNTSIKIGDSERKSGLYILGKPRMYKSWLMANMILQDIENGHGILFLDPHGDAIDAAIRFAALA